ncbi:MAG TPA: tetratricopeptide repeat protein [Edaphobacter sp.]|nr:tetratricopeptide repeat protein [Edaphobacter sp.]
MSNSISKSGLNPRWVKTVVAIVFACAAAGGLTWYLRAAKSRPKSAPTQQAFVNPGYVDAQVCTACHAEIASTFKKTGMGRSFYRPTAENVIEDYKRSNTYAHKASGLQYRMEERDGKFYQRRYTLEDGKEANVVEAQVDYVLGSGNHARTYLHRTPQGKLVELPVSWYVEHSGYWNMSPGFDRADQPDMHGTIGSECMFCHNAYLQPNEAPQKKVEETVFPAKMPEGIDCQRCHGPGAAHVAAATQGKASVEEIRSKIVNPAKLPRERQLEVCLECHMETSARHIPSGIRTYGRYLESFRPGEALGDYKTYFERPKDPKADEFEVAHAGYGLLKSACFLNSQMTCLTCHNPHDVPHGAAAKKQYIAVCENCHHGVEHKNVAMTAGSDCLSCHMPKRRTEGSVHIVLTDHSIQRFRPLRDLTAPFPEQLLPEDHTPVKIFYPRPAPQDERTKLLLAVARADDNGINGTGELQAMLDQQSSVWPEPYVALGKAYAQKNKTADATRSFEQALQRDPEDRAALRELAALLMNTGQLDRAAETLQKGSKLYPDDDGFLANLANVYFRQNKLDEAKQTLTQAMAVNPNRADVYDLAGLVAVQKADKTTAEQSFREAIRLQPNLPEPYNNLANLLAGERRLPEAESSFRRALELNPQYADAHHALGLLLILEHKTDDATRELMAAAHASPKDAGVHADLADLLSAEGRLSDAIVEYRQALSINAGQPDANLGLAVALLQQGQRDEAMAYLQRASQSGDPEISQHAQGLLQQMLR